MKIRVMFLSALLFVSLFVLTVTAPAFAVDNYNNITKYIDSEYISYLKSDFVRGNAKQSLIHILQNLDFAVDHFAIGTDPRIELDQIQVVISPKNYSVSDTQDGVHFSTSNNSAQISIGEIKVNQIVERKIGGVIVRLKITASCKGAQVAFNDTTSTIDGDLSPVIDGKFFKLKLMNPKAQFGTPNFQFSAMKCEGAQGFEDLITSTIQNTLADPQGLNALVQDQFYTRVSQYLDSNGYQWTTPQLILKDNRFEVWLFPKTIQKLKSQDNWQSGGILRISVATSPDDPDAGKTQTFPLENKDYSDLADQTVFVLPENTIQALIQAYLMPGQWELSVPSNEVPGFQDLMHSRLKQLFIWPELMKYQTSSIFLFNSRTLKEVNTKWNAGNSLNLQTDVGVNMLAPKNNQYIPFMNFQISLATPLTIQFNQQKLELKVQGSAMGMDYEWDPSYTSVKGSADVYFSKSKIKNAAQSFIEGYSFMMPIPAIKTALGFTISPKEMNHDSIRKSVIFNF